MLRGGVAARLTCDADEEVGEVLKHSGSPLGRVGVAMDVYLYLREQASDKPPSISLPGGLWVLLP